MNKTANSKTTFKFLNLKLYVQRIRANPNHLSAHNSTLSKGGFARYYLTIVDLKTFTFPNGLKSHSMDNALVGTIPKRLYHFIFIGSLDANPFNFRHYDLSSFAPFVNWRQIPNEGLSLGMDNEKSSVMRYRTFFDGSGIHHLNSGLQIRPDI